MTTNKELGRLKRVELRDAWKTEAGDFTPWLASEENIELLGDTLRIELEVEAQEKNVGPFRADILCKDTANDHWVLIENQLERTDHTHLGQLITYAAGLNAVTIVWIASRFTDEHRAATDWLNDATDEDFRFFALEIELWQIGDSAVAPKFNVVSSPNDWTKTVSQTTRKTELTPTKSLQLEFWSKFREQMEEVGSTFKPTKPLPQHWMNIAIGRSGMKLTAIASLWDSESNSSDDHELRAQLDFFDGFAKSYFSQLEDRKDEIEKALGEPLTWHNPEGKNSCRVFLRTKVDLHDLERWDEYHRWLQVKIELLREVLGPIARDLNTDDESQQDFE